MLPRESVESTKKKEGLRRRERLNEAGEYVPIQESICRESLRGDLPKP